MLTNYPDGTTNQQVRECLSAHGFTPLCQLGQAEHWVRAGRRVTVHTDEDGEIKDLLWATITKTSGGGLSLSLH